VNIVAGIASGPGGGSLIGTVSVATDGAGSAAFSGLGITGAAGTYTLSFSSAGVTSVTSGGIDLGPFEMVEVETPDLIEGAVSYLTSVAALLVGAIDREGAQIFITPDSSLSRFDTADGTTSAVMNTSGIGALAQRVSEPVRASPRHWATMPVHHKPDL
jgi:hypothetical protein